MNLSKSFVVSMHDDRLDSFLAGFKDSEIDLPFPEHYPAIVGKRCTPPRDWVQGCGAWGCYRSHMNIIERALQEDLDEVWIFEEDAVFCDDARERFHEFMARIPVGWQQAYIGGQHIHEHIQKPTRVNDSVLRPFNVNRTHAYGLRGKGIEKAYMWLASRTEWKNYHVDHHFGRLHENRQIDVYCPVRWIVGQGAGVSTISGGSYPVRFWNDHEIAGGDSRNNWSVEGGGANLVVLSGESSTLIQSLTILGVKFSLGALNRVSQAFFRGGAVKHRAALSVELSRVMREVSSGSGDRHGLWHWRVSFMDEELRRVAPDAVFLGIEYDRMMLMATCSCRDNFSSFAQAPEADVLSEMTRFLRWFCGVACIHTSDRIVADAAKVLACVN